MQCMLHHNQQDDTLKYLSTHRIRLTYQGFLFPSWTTFPFRSKIFEMILLNSSEWSSMAHIERSIDDIVKGV